MNGIELSEHFFNQYGKDMLSSFSQYSDKIAVGIVGEGSECYGYDDDFSRDHDFCAGFCIWISEDSDRGFGFPLMRAYSNLPKEFMGVKLERLSLYSPSKFGVFTIPEFYRRLIGEGKPFTQWQQWFYTPEYALANATNGKIFLDPEGAFTQFRQNLLTPPQDVVKKKIAARLAFMAQSGQYNFERCLKHSERAAAQTALFHFVDHATSLIYTLNNAYAPFYKWRFKGIRNLPTLSALGNSLEDLLTNPLTDAEKLSLINSICAQFITQLSTQKLSSNPSDYLESHAVEIMKTISHREIRSLHLMEL